jgi:glycosyltransferase involved in cell wall biosynthesis
MTAVTLAYAHNGFEVTHSFSQSLLHLMLHDASHGGHIVDGGYIPTRCGTNGLVGARNLAIKTFLEVGKGDWLLWVDTDMGFERDSVEKLLAVADPIERPIVGGLCFGQKETDEDGYFGYRTSARVTIFNWVQTDPNNPAWFTARAWYPPNSVVPCAGTGSAFILIHKTVFERIAEEYGPVWYDQLKGDDGELIGEDISFCVRANALQFPIHVHTGVRTTHMKHLWLSETDFWDQHRPPPATEEVAVVVPVLDRPQNAEPFMRSLRASTGLATAYAIYDADDLDTMRAWKEAGATVIESTGKRFGTKINDGYRATSEPWLLLVGDDVRFHPGWLDHAEYASAASGCQVIGCNDLGNPRVMRGEHATHMIIAREYVDRHGASWDGPGIVCHAGYRHWFVDDEIVTLAKARQTFVVALGSKVEHLHPLFGKGAHDATYELGQRSIDADRRLFEKRAEANA